MKPSIPDHKWQALSLAETLELFRPAVFDWALAGGYAVEQFVGRQLRSHEDVDVMIFRDQQLLAQDFLAGWRMYCADPPGQLREWQFGEYLPVGVHDIWFHENGSEWWRFQLVLAETDGDAWYFRKDRAICGLRQGLVAEYHGTPCVRIDVQLFYKSRSNRERDTYDFQACLPLLDSDQRRSLQRMISRFNPDGHQWLSQL